MKKLYFVFCLLFLNVFLLNAQTDVSERTSEVGAIIDEHTGPLGEYQTTLAEHKTHLEERIIVLKYHKTNKEVQEASGLVVGTIEDYYKAVTEKIQEYESVWFDQTRNIIAIYTRYGELREATGGGQNDLSSFVDKHVRYLDLLENVKSDLIGVYTDLQFIKNNI